MNKRTIILSVVSLLSLSSLNAGAMDLTLRDGLNGAKAGLDSAARIYRVIGQNAYDFSRQYSFLLPVAIVGVYGTILARLAFPRQTRRGIEKVKRAAAQVANVVTSTPVQASVFGVAGGVAGSYLFNK